MNEPCQAMGEERSVERGHRRGWNDQERARFAFGGAMTNDALEIPRRRRSELLVRLGLVGEGSKDRLEDEMSVLIGVGAFSAKSNGDAGIVVRGCPRRQLLHNVVESVVKWG